MNVYATWIKEAAVFLSDADDLVAMLHHETGCVGTDVAESLDYDAAAFNGHVEVPQALIACDHHTAARGLDASMRAADIEWFSCHDAGDGSTHVHGVGIHNPCHRLLVGVDVGCGNIFLRPDEVDDL